VIKSLRSLHGSTARPASSKVQATLRSEPTCSTSGVENAHPPNTSYTRHTRAQAADAYKTVTRHLPFCELQYRCLAKLPENVNPEIDRHRYHRHYGNQDDEQWRYFCFSTPDNIKLNSICDSNDDSSDNKSSDKEVDHGVNPEIDRHRYHRDYDNQDDEQWRYFCFSTPDTIKNNSIGDCDDDGSDNKSPHKEVDYGFTPYASVLIFDSKTVSDSLVA